MKYLLLASILFIFSACAFYNPFIPPLHNATVYTETSQEPIVIQTESCEPIATDPMYRATMRPYTVRNKRYCPTVVKVGETFRGIASWYGDDFHGKQTSNGEYYNMYDLTAAHKTLPINTIVKVTNLQNNMSTIVRINDRGPFVNDRIIDLSYAAAQEIDMIKHGTAKVELEIIKFDKSATKYEHKQEVEVQQKQLSTAPKDSVWKRYDPQAEERYLKEIENRRNNEKISEVVVAGGDYSIQIASFTSKEKAQSLKEKCYNNQYKPFIKNKVYDDKTIYRVLLNGFKSIQEAKDYIKSEHYNGAFIIRN